MKKIVVLTGAGMSVESGLKTFRDADGLWEEYPVQQVAVTYPIGEKEVKDAVKELNPDTDSLGSRG